MKKNFNFDDYKNMAIKIYNKMISLGGQKSDVGIVCGSGWSEVCERLKNKIEIKFSDIEGMPECGVKGHKSKFVFGELGDKKVVCMAGRFHLYEGYSSQEVTLPVFVLSLFGIKNIILTNSAGGVNLDYNVGDIMIIGDHINFTADNPLIGIKPTEQEPIFIDMSCAYDKTLREIATDACQKCGIKSQNGVYIQLKGPNYETPSEIKAFRILGADAVGMSTVQECIMAKFLNIKVVALSFISNKASGITNESLNHADVLNRAEINKQKLSVLIEKLVKGI